MKKSVFATLNFGLLCISYCVNAEQPNILFIFSDDHSYEAIGKLGILNIDTPNLDRLMNSGTSFSHAYNMGSWTGAVCIASRTMLNTGTTVWNAPQNRRALNEKIQAGKTWSQMLKAAGYRTYMTGKWHLPSDVSSIFDVVADVRPGMPEDVLVGYKRPRDEKHYELGWKPWEHKWGGFWEGGTHWSELIADHAEQFLIEASEDDSPFFMYLAFNAPHDPRQSPKTYVDQYPFDRIQLPKNFKRLYPYKEDIGCGQDLRDEDLAPFPRSEYSVKVNRQEYYAIITHMDEQIGRILKALNASGKADNTYVFFTADHGLAVGHHGLMGKQNMYEHSLRVPFIISGPGIEKNALRKQFIYLQDIMPTTLEMAGAIVPEEVEFKSLIPIIDDANLPHYNHIYGCYKENLQRAIISGDFKLILYPEIDVVRLYDLKNDPEENIDLASDPTYFSTLDRLSRELEKLQQKLSDPLKI